MKCGYCNQEMIEGYIPGITRSWIPKGKKHKLRFRGPKKEGFNLSPLTIFTTPELVAWYCPDCDKVVIDGNQGGTKRITW